MLKYQIDTQTSDPALTCSVNNSGLRWVVAFSHDLKVLPLCPTDRTQSDYSDST